MLRLVGTELRREIRDAAALEVRPASKKPGARRVLFLDHTAAMGGGEIALLNALEAIDRDRVDPVVVLFLRRGAACGKTRGSAGVETYLLELDAPVGDARKDTLGLGAVLGFRKFWTAAAFVRRLAKLIRALQPEVVHTNSLKSDVLGGLAAWLAGVPCVWHVRDRIAEDYLPGPAAWMIRRMARWIPRRVVANSEATLQTLQLPPRYAKRRRARVVHDGVSGQWRMGEVAASKVQHRQGHLRIGIVGRISPWKGQDVFLRAAAEVRKQFPHAHFAIIGAALFAEHAYEDSLRALVRELGLEENVEFTGFRQDVPALMAELDILVHASTIGEPFGQVVAEGMAAGCAVIATRGGGVPEIVVDGESGLLVPMGDAAAMAEAILRLASDAELRKRLGEAGRQRIFERFTIEKTARALEDCWEELCGGRPGTDQ